MMNTTWEQLSLQSFDLVMHVIPLSTRISIFMVTRSRSPPFSQDFWIYIYTMLRGKVSMYQAGHLSECRRWSYSGRNNGRAAATNLGSDIRLIGMSSRSSPVKRETIFCLLQPSKHHTHFLRFFWAFMLVVCLGLYMTSVFLAISGFRYLIFCENIPMVCRSRSRCLFLSFPPLNFYRLWIVYADWRCVGIFTCVTFTYTMFSATSTRLNRALFGRCLTWQSV